MTEDGHQLLQIVVFLGIMLTGCSTAQISQEVADVGTVAAQVQAGCQEAAPLLPLASLIPQAALIANGVAILCASQPAILRAAADPSTPQWIGQQIALLKGLVEAPSFLRS